MAVVFFGTTLMLAASLLGADAVPEHVRELFQGKTYITTWGQPRTFDPHAELEIGDGSGHGGSLGWVRFLPGTDGVDVLSIRFDEDHRTYRTKWAPDNPQVVSQAARMSFDDYAALLADLAVIDAVEIRARTFDRSQNKMAVLLSSSNFWVSAQLLDRDKSLLDLDWAGYEGTSGEVEYAKPRAAVTIARTAIKKLDFQDHALTPDDRAWASTKFVRDWPKLNDHANYYWWVRERYLQLIGLIGDATALPTLTEILQADRPNKGDRTAYYAINAFTRLTGHDVRDKPVEEMDVDKTRQRVLKMLKDRR